MLTRQVVGVPDVETGRRMAEVLRATGSQLAMVVTGDGGLDELSTTGPNTVHTVTPDGVETSNLDPVELGIARATVADLRGGDAETNARIARSVLGGDAGPRADIIVLNAAAGLLVAGVASDMIDGIERARAAIESGAAAERLERLVALTNELSDT
jgi:anthranilate phosphoribosyltransferase